jgi:hypothetical protein
MHLLSLPIPVVLLRLVVAMAVMVVVQRKTKDLSKQPKFHEFPTFLIFVESNLFVLVVPHQYCKQIATLLPGTSGPTTEAI